MTTTATSPTPPARPTSRVGARISNALKRVDPRQMPPEHMFYGANLIIGTFIVYIALTSEAIFYGSPVHALVANHFPTTAGLTVGIFTLVISAWPIIRNIRAKQMVPSVLLIVLIPLMGFAVNIAMRWTSHGDHSAETMAVSIWSVVIFGKIIAFLAPLLNAVLVFKIAYLVSVHPEFIALEEEVAKATKSQADEKILADAAGRRRDIAEAEAEAKRNEYDIANAALANASKAYSKAQKDSLKTPENKEETDAEQELKQVNDDETEFQRTTFENSAEKLKQENDGPEYEASERKIRQAEINLLDIVPRRAEATARLRKAKAAKAKSVAQIKLVKAEAARDAASLEEAETRETKKVYKQASRLKELEFTQAGTSLKEKEDTLEEAQKALLEKSESQNTDYKGVYLRLGVLFFLTVGFYVPWVGWVLSSSGPGTNF